MNNDTIPEGMLRYISASEHATGDVTPIAVEKMEAGKWVRLGYACGMGPSGRIVSLEEWQNAAIPD